MKTIKLSQPLETFLEVTPSHYDRKLGNASEKFAAPKNNQLKVFILLFISSHSII